MLGGVDESGGQSRMRSWYNGVQRRCPWPSAAVEEACGRDGRCAGAQMMQCVDVM